MILEADDSEESEMLKDLESTLDDAAVLVQSQRQEVENSAMTEVLALEKAENKVDIEDNFDIGKGSVEAGKTSAGEGQLEEVKIVEHSGEELD